MKLATASINVISLLILAGFYYISVIFSVFIPCINVSKLLLQLSTLRHNFLTPKDLICTQMSHFQQA